MSATSSNDSYTKAIEFLNGLQVFGARFGLENTFKLAALSGNPQQQLRFIHVAGTNGKGSTCAMLESIYRAAGLRVGLFTSPHLVSFRERLQVNRQLISEANVVRLIEKLEPVLKEFSNEQSPTFFEVATVMALNYFAEQKCDLVIWETGLGGRLDATNIVTPLASVITNIGFDHQQWLGDTLEIIATEKAGIIKPCVPVITAEEKQEPLRAIQAIANERRSLLTRSVLDARCSILDSLPLIGAHQRANAALALATVNALQEKIPVTEQQVHEGLANVNWPGRLQTVTRPSGQKILLDGAHNPDGADALRAALRTGAPVALILGILGDKNCRVMCELLAPLAAWISLVPVKSERTAAPEELAAFCCAANSSAVVQTCDSLSDALGKNADKSFVVIAGSLYLIGEAMELLGVGPAPERDEKSLNEWKAKPSR